MPTPPGAQKSEGQWNRSRTGALMRGVMCSYPKAECLTHSLNLKELELESPPLVAYTQSEPGMEVGFA